MPDLKGELRKRFEVEVVGRGLDEQEWEERAVVREHRAWLESALSTAEQRIEELEGRMEGMSDMYRALNAEHSKAEATIVELRAELSALQSNPGMEREKALVAETIDICVGAMKSWNVSAYDVIDDGKGNPEQEQFDIIGYIGSLKEKEALDSFVTAFLAQREGK